MTDLDEICSELSKMSSDICSLDSLSHGELDFYIYRLEQIWKNLFVIHYESSKEATQDDAILLYIRDAIRCLNDCNAVLDLSYRCPAYKSGKVGRPRLSVAKEQLEYLIDNDFSAIDNDFERCSVGFRASYSSINNSELDVVITEIIGEFPNIGYRRVQGELGRRK